ncbi:hypothetical protein ISCGN_008844 [Ixodes scapularis]
MPEGVAIIISLASRKILRCNKQLLEHITVISVKGANCKLMKRKLQCGLYYSLTESILLFMQEGTIPTAPCVAFSGYDVEAAKSMNIHVDTVWLFEVQDAEDGFTVVMAAYWLFGFTHGKKTYNTSCLLEKLCLILIYSQLRPVAIKVINTIKATPVA